MKNKLGSRLASCLAVALLCAGTAVTCEINGGTYELTNTKFVVNKGTVKGTYTIGPDSEVSVTNETTGYTTVKLSNSPDYH